MPDERREQQHADARHRRGRERRPPASPRQASGDRALPPGRRRGRCAAAATARSPESPAARSTGIRSVWSDRRQAPRSRRGPIRGAPGDRTHPPHREETATRCRWRRKNTRTETPPAATAPRAPRSSLELVAREQIHVDERAEERGERHERAGEQVRGRCCRRAEARRRGSPAATPEKRRCSAGPPGRRPARTRTRVVAMPTYQSASQRIGRFISSLSKTRSVLHFGARARSRRRRSRGSRRGRSRGRVPTHAAAAARHGVDRIQRGDRRRQMPVDRLLAREDGTHERDGRCPHDQANAATSS